MSKTIGHWFQCTEPGCGADFESAEHPQNVKCPNNPDHWLRSKKIIKCDCGAELTLFNSWSNGCDCGREYNSAGQELAPRRFWGEETGEVFEHCQED